MAKYSISCMFIDDMFERTSEEYDSFEEAEEHFNEDIASKKYVYLILNEINGNEVKPIKKWFNLED